MQPGSLAVGPLAIQVVVELVIGAIAGYAIGRFGRLLLRRLPLPASGLYPGFTVALALLAFGAATLVHGSGFLAVYLAGVALGEGTLPYATSIRRVHDALGWLSQVVMFLALGLLVFPSRLANVAPIGLGLAVVLAFIARPVAVALCLAPSAMGGASSCTSAGWVSAARCPSCSRPSPSWRTPPAHASCSTSCSSWS